MFNAYSAFWSLVAFLAFLFLSKYSLSRYLIVFSFSCRLPEAVVDGVHHQDRAQVPGCGRDGQDGWQCRHVQGSKECVYIWTGICPGSVIKRVFTLVIILGRVRDERDKYKKFFEEQKDSWTTMTLFCFLIKMCICNQLLVRIGDVMRGWYLY